MTAAVGVMDDEAKRRRFEATRDEAVRWYEVVQPCRYCGEAIPLECSACLKCLERNRLCIAHLQRVSVERSAEFHSLDWTPSQWLQALVGEVGEYANLRKKHERGDIDAATFKRLAEGELADIQCYLVLLADRLGIDLASATVAKFNEVSDRIGSVLRLPEVVE